MTTAPRPASPPSSTSPAQLSCAYSVVNSWSGGFQAQVVISNAGSGANVTVTNEPYNGSIAPGSSVTIGFTATGTAPSSLMVTC
jgi:Cellulose binding domain